MKFENVHMVLPGHKVGFGSIEFEGGRITAIHLSPTPTAFSNSSLLVLPGLINCHGHTPMTLVRGLGGGLPLQRWLEEAIFPVEAKMTPADVKAGMVWGVLEMLAGGTTCVADMYDFPGACLDALRETGFRGRVGRVGLSFVPGRLEDCISFLRRGKDSSSPMGGNARSGGIPSSALTDIDLCIHSEYLTDEKFCRGLAEANGEFRRPLNFHCSETKKEHEECIARHGKTPIAYLASTGILDHGGYAAHCVYCTDDDFRIMAEKRVSLVHNPSSNMKLGSGFARIVRAMELGVNVALGTDGCASNDNLDMFEEMHLASLIHKGLACDPTALPAWDVIDMATVNGAKALGMSDVGEIAVGKQADFCVVDLDRIHLVPTLDIPNLVVHSMHASDVVETWVAGRKLYDRGAFAAVDFEAVKNDFISSVKRLGLWFLPFYRADL